jgi:hypothetical protein
MLYVKGFLFVAPCYRREKILNRGKECVRGGFRNQEKTAPSEGLRFGSKIIRPFRQRQTRKSRRFDDP